MPHNIKFSRTIRTALAAILVTVMGCCSNNYATAGQIYIVLAKPRILLSSHGSGNLFSHGRRMRLHISGINFDALPVPIVRIVGDVSNLDTRSDIFGSYTAAPGGTTVVRSTAKTRLENKHGVVLELSALEMSPAIGMDLAGMKISR